MKRQEKLKHLMREVLNLIINFFKPYGLSDEMVSIPPSIKRMGFKVCFMSFAMTVISLIFAFMLKATNMMIEYRLILLGIIFFMLYRGQQVVREAFHAFENSEQNKFDLILKNEIVFIGSQIIGKTSNKVSKYDTSNKWYKVMKNESMLNTIGSYLKNLWLLKIHHIFDIFEIISTFLMLFFAIVTNTSVDQVIFINLIFIFMLISFFSSAYISLYTDLYYQKNREYDNEQSLIVNDLLRVPSIIPNDLDMRISKFQKTVISSNQNAINYHKKLNFSRLFVAILETFSQYGFITFYLLEVEWNSINLATITEITATLLIVETALVHISRIAKILNNHNSKLIALKKEETDMSLILDVYHKEATKLSKPKTIDNIIISPFSIQYLEESENDKPFTLISRNTICINNGEIAILYGPSGSGKSTFMKMLTEKIKLKKSSEIPSTSRFLSYDENLKFGSLSIYEELFCCCENPDLIKMQTILENLHLWYEIKSNCFDVWKWMKEKQFEHSLSNGQKQRLILAKMLYWLNEEIDVLVLDECTSGLDDKSESDSADAERTLEYIVRYSNKDKKRIVIISTHQNIDGFKHNLSNEYTFRNLQFLKEGHCNLVKEI